VNPTQRLLDLAASARILESVSVPDPATAGTSAKLGALDESGAISADPVDPSNVVRGTVGVDSMVRGDVSLLGAFGFPRPFITG
jgi:hypothetical protein